MNEELTRNLSTEELKAIAKTENGLIEGNIITCMGIPLAVLIQHLAAALLEEREKPKVWDGAPEWAKIGRVYWTDGYEQERYSKLYNREIPKTRARQIAEEIDAALEAPRYTPRIEVIEKLLNKYAEELEGKE